ncbi:hypothetical protein ABPG74_019859 [Tetrahymena malaccensis]
MSYTDSLNKILALTQYVETKLLNMKQQQIYDEVVQKQLITPILLQQKRNKLANIDASYEESNSQSNDYYDSEVEVEEDESDDGFYNQEETNIEEKFRVSKDLENLIISYQSLILQLMYENEDSEIIFRNPVSIEIKSFKVLEFEKLSLNIDTKYYQNYYISKTKHYSQFHQIQQLLKEQNISLKAHHLEINQFIQFLSMDSSYDPSVDSEGNYFLPFISSNYIYLQIQQRKNDFESSVIKVQLKNKALNEKYRVKLIIINKASDYEIQVQDFNKKFEIPSIMQQAQCFIFIPQIQYQNDLNELLLEDQIILSIVLLNKLSIQDQLQNSISMIFTDMFFL